MGDEIFGIDISRHVTPPAAEPDYEDEPVYVPKQRHGKIPAQPVQDTMYPGRLKEPVKKQVVKAKPAERDDMDKLLTAGIQPDSAEQGGMENG